MAGREQLANSHTAEENQPERCRAFKCPPLLPPISLLGEGIVKAEEEERPQACDRGKDKVGTDFDINTVLLKRIWPAKVDLILPRRGHIIKSPDGIPCEP